MRRHYRNPLPRLETSLAEAEQLVDIITRNAFPKKTRRNPSTPEWYTPIVDPALAQAAGYDPEMFTPLNIVAANVKPKVSQQLLAMFLEDPIEKQGGVGFYRSIIDELESTTKENYDFNTGKIPESWRERKVRFGKERPSLLREGYDTVSDDYKTKGMPYPTTYDDFEDKLSQKKKTAQRRLRRKRRL